MKLRNKKTGEVLDAYSLMLTQTIKTNNATSTYAKQTYYSLAELNEEWEDYKPKEPLIKDEKIRKAVRAWAEANDIEAGLYNADTFSIGSDDNFISFNNGFADETKIYTIAELCGEDER